MRKELKEVLSEIMEREPVRDSPFLFFESLTSLEGKKILFKDYERKTQHVITLGDGWLSYEEYRPERSERIVIREGEPVDERVLTKMRGILRRYDELKKKDESLRNGEESTFVISFF